MPPRSASSAPYPPEISVGNVKLAHISDIDVGGKIPGYRASAAFFASLKANLRLNECSSPLPSPVPAPLGHSRKNLRIVTSQTNPSAGELSPPSPLVLSSAKTEHDSNHLVAARQALNAATGSSKKTPTQAGPNANTDPRITELTSPYDDVGDDTESRPSLYWTSSRKDSELAISLLKATITEQSDFAFRRLLLHPVNLLSFAILLVIVQKSMFCVTRYTSLKYTDGQKQGARGSPFGADVDNASWLAVLMVWTGLALFFLAVARFVTWPYHGVAKRLVQNVDLECLGDAEAKKTITASVTATDPWFKPGRDEVLVAVADVGEALQPALQNSEEHVKGDDEKSNPQPPQERKEVIVGVLIMQWAPCVASAKMNKRRRSSGGRGYVKAWAVDPGWRGQGIGASLLTEASRMAMKERGGDCTVFVDKHAHSERVLPNFYNGPFDRRDRRARVTLLNIVAARPWANTRRR